MIKKIFLLLLCALLSACAGKSTGGIEEPSDPVQLLSQRNEDFLYLSAQDSIRQGQIQLAIQFLKALVKKNPDKAMPRLQLADMLLRSSQPAEAMKYLSAIIGNSTPKSVLTDDQLDAHILRARALAMSGHYEEASDVLSSLLIRHPELVDTRVMLVSILAVQNRIDEAHFVIAQGLKLEKAAELYKADADLYIRQNRLDKAARALESMLKVDPDNDTAVILLSQIAEKNNDHAQSEQLLRDFLEKHPEALLVRNALGRILVNSGRIPEAIGIYKSIVRDTGGTPEAMSALGLLYFETEQYENAVEQLSKVVEIIDDAQSRFYLAASLEALGKAEKAKEQYLKIGKQSPAYLNAQLRVSGIELIGKQTDNAIRRVKALVKEFPKSGQVYAMLSAIYASQEKFRELLDETEAAMSLPNIPLRLLINRAAAFEHFKQYEQVENTLKLALRLNPKYAEALNFLGYIYAEQGIKLDEAVSLVKQALVQSPDDGYYLDSLAWIYFKQGSYKLAIETQSRAMKQVKDDPVMHEHMGDMLWKAGEHDKARSYWQKAIELKHEKPGMLKGKIERGLDQE